MKQPTLAEVTIIEKLQQVSWEIANLNVNDAEGHIWWNRFKEFLIKGTDIVECKTCGGEGYCVEYHRESYEGEYSASQEPCGDCCGHGYLVNDVVLGVNVKIIDSNGDDLPF